MDKITPEQYKRWKNNQVGKLFFKFLEDNIEINRVALESITKNPLPYSQEEFYKKCLEYGITMRTWQELLDVKIDFIQPEEEKDDTSK